MTIPADILLYAVIAAGLVFWLRSILGTGSGDNPNSTQFKSPLDGDNKPVDSKPAAVPMNNFASPAENINAIENVSDILDRNMSMSDEAAAGLKDISLKDKAFNLPFFLRAVQDAFIYIVEAFAEGDRNTLKDLLSENVYKAFDAALDAREKQGLKTSVEIHAVRKMELTNAWMKDRMAFITIRFIADETRVVRDDKGEVIEGNPDRVAETIDIWTFGRDVRSRSPAWVLYETRDEDAADQDHKTVPDSE